MEGAERLTNEYLQRAAAVPVDSTLLRVDTNGVTQRLQENPWIATIDVKREFPSTLVLVITEREPVAAVAVQADITSETVEQWLISDNGLWLGVAEGPESNVLITEEDLNEYKRFTDVDHTVKPVVGEVTEDEGILNALAILKGFSPQMNSLVSSIYAPDRNKTTLSLTNNVIVTFGAAEDIEAKEKAIITLLNDHPETLISINVRVADRPTYKFYEG